MSKGNMLMNLAQGKLGSMVFYRTKGEQRVRTYVKNVSNPKTVSQMTQRTQLSNLVTLYRVMNSLLVKGFTNKKSNQSDYNAFVSRNLARIPVYLPKAMAAGQGCVVAPYQITDGTIAPIAISGSGINAVTDIYLGEGFAITETTSVAEFSAAVLANNTDISSGMQLTYVSIVQINNPQTGYPSCSMNLYKVVFDTTNAALLIGELPIQALSVVDGFLGHGEKVADGAFAYILSKRTAKGALDVSPQSLIVTSDALYKAYSSPEARTRAGESYGEAPDPFLNPDSESVGQGSVSNLISSVSVNGEILVQNFPGPKTFAAASPFIIRGSGLDAGVISIALSTSATRLTTEEAITAAVTVADLLTDPVATSTSISGGLKTAFQSANQIVVLADNTIVYQVTSSNEAPDPKDM